MAVHAVTDGWVSKKRKGGFERCSFSGEKSLKTRSILCLCHHQTHTDWHEHKRLRNHHRKVALGSPPCAPVLRGQGASSGPRGGPAASAWAGRFQQGRGALRGSKFPLLSTHMEGCGMEESTPLGPGHGVLLTPSRDRCSSCPAEREARASERRKVLISRTGFGQDKE